MSQPIQPPQRLVQIEPLKKPAASSAESETPAIEIPKFTDAWVYRTKTRITFRKIASFFYARHSYGAARRWVLSSFLPDRILYRWKPYQRGGCNRCGLCCKLTFRCSFFVENEHTTACMIYTTKHATPPCVVFPIDPIDLREVQREIAPAPCPFYFEGQPEHPTTWGAVKAELRHALGKRVDKLKEAFDF
jgi:hypothetical protein